MDLPEALSWLSTYEADTSARYPARTKAAIDEVLRWKGRLLHMRAAPRVEGRATGLSFLDLVRAVGAATHGGCCEGCSERLHRAEAARHLGALLKRPDLIRALERVAERKIGDGR